MIRLYASDEFWQRLLGQEGVAFDTGLPGDDTAVLILNRSPASDEADLVRRFAERGGGLLSDAESASDLLRLKTTVDRARTILPDGSPLFRHVGPVDVIGPVFRIEDAKHGRLGAHDGAILTLQIDAGTAVILPFDPAAALADRQTAARAFRSPGPRHAHETVSWAGRGEVRRLVANCLRRLLFERSLPYVHLPYTPSPGGVFGFRIDTDASSPDGLRRAASVVDRAGVRATWFVNTGTHLGDLDWFSKLARDGHDIQLHCHKHRVFRDERRNLANTRTGFELMRQHRIAVTGTAAPYGNWNEGLARVFAGLGLSYSSEFTCGYDDLPFRPLIDGAESAVLQVPVHPICTGSLSQARVTNDAMVDYYRQYVSLQHAREEPCFLYDHPEAIARREEVSTSVIGGGLGTYAGAQITMTEYATWWNARRAALSQLRVACRDGRLTAHGRASFVVELEDRLALAEPSKTSVRLAQLQWQDASATIPAGWGVRTACDTARGRISSLAQLLRKSLQERFA